MLASAWFLFRGRLLGGWIYIGLFILSAIWGFAEARGNAWAMVPWLIAPLVLLIAVLLVMPTLTPRRNRWKLAGGGIALAVLFVIASFAVLGNDAAAAPRGASRAKLARHDRPVACRDRRRLAGLWRDQRRLALLAADPDRRRPTSASCARCGKCTPAGCPTNPDYAKLYGTENTPLKVGNLLYTCTAKNVIVALDAATGKPVWRVDPKVPDKWIPVHDRVPRRRLLPGAGRRRRNAVRRPDHRRDARFAPDRGRRADRQGVHRLQRHRPAGHQDRHGPGLSRARRRSTPRRPIVRGIIVVPHQILDGQCRCSPSGVIQGFDAKTGKLAWAWDMQHPDWNGYPPAGPDLDQGHAQQLDEQRGDEKLGLVYLPIGNVAADYISTGRTPRSNQVRARSSRSTSPPASRAGVSRRSRRTCGTMTSAASRR